MYMHLMLQLPTPQPRLHSTITSAFLHESGPAPQLPATCACHSNSPCHRQDRFSGESTALPLLRMLPCC